MRTGGRALVESSFPLDIRPLVRGGAIRDDIHVEGEMKFGPPDDDDDDDDDYGVSGIAFEVSTLDHANRWIRVRCTVTNLWSGKQREINDEIHLTTSRAGFAGRKWWFVCPGLGVRARALYLPEGARYFRSRLDRLAAAEDDLDLPLTRGGPRFAYRWDRQSGDGG